MPKKIFTEQEKQEIIYQYSVEKIGSHPLSKKYGCSAPTLLKNLKEWGIEPNQKKLDLTNQRFGKLIVIKPAPKREDRYTRWICQCDCGKMAEVRTDYLTSQHTLSCGCEKTQYFQRTVQIGATYGKLKPLEYDTEKQQYLCQCDCGNQAYVLGYNLTNGNTQSCGCLKSKGELKINQILTALNIPFQNQYSFEDCRFPETNRMAYFDYAIFDNENNLHLLLEYDGIQHEIGWDNDENSLLIIQEHDKFKTQYCLDKNIPLVRISHRDYNKLNEKYFKDLLKENKYGCYR